METKKYTIKDVAKLAGVSKGTVDRVLHKRGKVSEKALKKVNKVLKELEFEPNPIARNLKNNKIYRICVLLPDSNIDPYWIPARNGIKSATKEFKPFGVLVDEYLYHPREKDSFMEIAKEAIDSKPDVMLMAPLFHNESIMIYKVCQEHNILMALFNNYIDSIDGELFIGQDLVQCGRIGANLIHKMVGGKSKIAIVHINKEPHMQLKENGFKNYFSEHSNIEHELITQCFNTGTQTDFEDELPRLLDTHKDIKAIFVTNSKAHRLVEELDKLNFECTVVGFDLLEKNIEYLKAGKIDFLLHQKPKRQAYLGVGYLAEYFLFGKSIPSQKLLPIDIITSENVKYHVK